MTTKHRLIILALLVLAVGAYAILTDSRFVFTGAPETACTMEAKICPDGSAVGRTGPNCEFADCPAVQNPGETPASAGTVVVTAKIGQRVEALGETLVLRKVLDDSRCPRDVQCIWAGTVRVEGTVEGGMGVGQLTFELGKSSTTEVNTFTLIGVDPVPLGGAEIEDSSYIFTFQVSRR